MQDLAREMNFAESVFALPAEAGDADVRIRIFTPVNELPFAGHPTLGSAFVLGGPLDKPVVRLETAVGVIPVALERELNQITGIVTVGLFAARPADVLIVGTAQGVETR